MTALDSKSASEQAIHKAKSAQAAVELSRELQLQEAVEKAAKQTKDALLDGLKEVFGDSDTADPQQMKVLVRRIPILCASVMQMHDDLADIKENIKWAVRIVLGGVLLAILKLVLIP